MQYLQRIKAKYLVALLVAVAKLRITVAVWWRTGLNNKNLSIYDKANRNLGTFVYH
jgi:hypothetical protein